MNLSTSLAQLHMICWEQLTITHFVKNIYILFALIADCQLLPFEAAL